MTKAIGYVRVSTQEQADHGYSIEAQVSKIKAYADLYDIELVDVVIDAGVSAKSLKREGLQRVLTTLDNGGADAVLIFKLDRLTRDVSDWNTLIKDYFTDKALLSVSDQIDTRTAAGRLCLNVLMSVAQWEREAIGERTSTALRQKQSQGEHVGSPAYGYEMVNKKLVKVATELEVIALVKQMSDDGFTLSAIATELNAQGIKTKRGGKWQAVQVSRVINREVA
ncbi:recombinase family protein [Pseudanabaena sp. FACHB-1277]|uniref:Recombinase family protein n=1 Tax=Pseudanabaena cinerea FACHB-1277 TaxID=2949581 RepID=A0A926Z8A2_9CYAN|nr:recombinase family protein [Pseudanabaena cinerea]MBD2152508.1 recombinase family protein [Pseudanabaena cinerea FACHB-1277]